MQITSSRCYQSWAAAVGGVRRASQDYWAPVCHLAHSSREELKSTEEQLLVLPYRCLDFQSALRSAQSWFIIELRLAIWLLYRVMVS